MEHSNIKNSYYVVYNCICKLLIFLKLIITVKIIQVLRFIIILLL